MKHSIILIGASLALGLGVTSCHDDTVLASGKGKVMLNAQINSDLKVTSRASSEIEESLLLYISNAKGPVRKYQGLSQVPAEPIDLVADNYIAQAWAGDSVPASFDKRFFKGQESFTVSNGQTANVNIVCKIANTAASVVYDPRIGETLSDYKMTIGHSGGTLEYVGQDERRGYFMMTPKTTDLEWSFTATLASGDTYSRKGTIANAKPATEYILHVSNNGETPSVGGAYFTIEIDERPLETIDHNGVIVMGPEIAGYNFDISQPLSAEPGKTGRRSVMVYGATKLSNVQLSSDILERYTTIGGNDVDLKTMSESVAQSLNASGITFSGEYDADEDTEWVKINFEEALLNQLPAGTHNIEVKAVDVLGKTGTATLVLNLTDAPVQTQAVNNTDVWATKATITGTILKDSATGTALRYRRAGTTEWTTAATEVKGTTMSALITGLTPGTTYEYQATADDFEPTDTRSFTTEAALQLPNASFENWYTGNKNIRMPNAQGDDTFWDSGNGGSAPLMQVNITDASSEKAHNGTYSAKLSSQFVGVGALGAFAAGNIFIGEFIRTDGTNGVLGWGRPFASRPSALKGYIHYTPQAITHTKVDGVNKGDMDKGIIYIAILDGTTDSDSGKNYPFIIKTKASDRQLFEKDAANVIGYGELVLTEATSGDAMVEFNIPINYRRNDVKAVNIAIVASASFYGDYFTGGPSVMYLDDLELVY